MSTKDISAMLPSVLTTSNRNLAASVKAIMHSRHANTRRNIKRPAPEPRIREMIVVKEYDQMDSLREVLEQPPRKYGAPSSVDDGEQDKVERAIENDLIPECQQGVKRKRDDDDCQSDHESSEEEPEQKRRRFTDNPGNQQEQEHIVMSDSPEVGIGGKENLPPEPEAPAQPHTKADAWTQNEEYYTWPAMMARVDDHFGLPSTFIQAPT